MVGRLGDAALASIGVGNYLFLLIFTVAMGLGTGVQALVSRRVGEGNAHLAGHDLNAGLLIAGILGFALIVLGYLILPFLFSLARIRFMLSKNKRGRVLNGNTRMVLNSQGVYLEFDLQVARQVIGHFVRQCQKNPSIFLQSQIS